MFFSSNARVFHELEIARRVFAKKWHRHLACWVCILLHQLQSPIFWERKAPQEYGKYGIYEKYASPAPIFNLQSSIFQRSTVNGQRSTVNGQRFLSALPASIPSCSSILVKKLNLLNIWRLFFMK